MNHSVKKEHSVDSFFSLLLFGLFVLFLLLLLLFSAEVYHSCVKGQEENNNLHTAMVYITTKFRQHDNAQIQTEDFYGMDALCFSDTIDGQEYITSLYLADNQLKELFTARDSQASPDMGMPIAALKSFSVEETESGLCRITMTDENNETARLLLHPGPPSAG